MTFGGVVCSSGSSGRPGASGCCGSAGSSGSLGSSGSSGTRGSFEPSGAPRSAVGSSGSTSGSGSGVGTISEPGIVVVGTVVSGSGVGSSSEPGIVVIGTVLSGAGSDWGSEVNNEDVVVGAVDSEGVGSEDSGSGSGVCLSVEMVAPASVVVVSAEVGVFEVGRSDGSAGAVASVDVVAFDGDVEVAESVDAVVCAGSVVCVVWEGSADDEDVEVAVGSFAASCGAGSELEDGAAAGVEAGVDSTLLAVAAAAAAAAEAAREIAWESWPWCSPRCLSWWPAAGVVARSV